MSFNPLPETTTSALSATVNNRNGGSVAPGTETLSNTPHGPEKSITLRPAEMRSATGMPPLVGGSNLDLPMTSPFGDSSIASALVAGNTIAAPVSAAVVVKKCRLFIGFPLICAERGDRVY